MLNLLFVFRGNAGAGFVVTLVNPGNCYLFPTYILPLNCLLFLPLRLAFFAKSTNPLNCIVGGTQGGK